MEEHVRTTLIFGLSLIAGMVMIFMPMIFDNVREKFKKWLHNKKYNLQIAKLEKKIKKERNANDDNVTLLFDHRNDKVDVYYDQENGQYYKFKRHSSIPPIYLFKIGNGKLIHIDENNKKTLIIPKPITYDAWKENFNWSWVPTKALNVKFKHKMGDQEIDDNDFE